MKKSKEREQWLAIAEKYFDAATTDQEEKALAEFLATDESNTPEFNEIKAVMGYVATARKAENALCGPQKPESRSRIRRWIATASVAATIAIICAICTVAISIKYCIWICYNICRHWSFSC